jgi:hypothetical protein
MTRSRRSWVFLAGLVGVFPLFADSAIGCGASPSRLDDTTNGGVGGADGGSALGGEGGEGSATASSTCDQAAALHSYVGCDYWPTVTANGVWSIFDYAVAGSTPADVTVTGPNAVNQKVTVAPGEIQKIYLPWVPALKGPDWDGDGNEKRLPPLGSTLAKGGAYHLVSTAPVVVYQFNALEYAPKGGPPGKDWSACPYDPSYDMCFVTHPGSTSRIRLRGVRGRGRG